MTPEAEQVLAGLEFRKPAVLRLIEPLTDEQMAWRPGPDRNSVAWQLWHIPEVEDNWVRDKLLGEAKRYPFGCSVREASNYPAKAELLRYLDEVRALTHQRLLALAPADFAKPLADEHFGNLMVRDLWAGLVTSFAWHAGQIALTVGLLRGNAPL